MRAGRVLTPIVSIVLASVSVIISIYAVCVRVNYQYIMFW